MRQQGGAPPNGSTSTHYTAASNASQQGKGAAPHAEAGEGGGAMCPASPPLKQILMLEGRPGTLSRNSPKVLAVSGEWRQQSASSPLKPVWGVGAAATPQQSNSPPTEASPQRLGGAGGGDVGGGSDAGGSTSSTQGGPFPIRLNVGAVAAANRQAGR